MKRGSAFPITRSSATAERAVARTAAMAWWLIGALLSMVPNPRRSFPAPTDRVNCPKPLPSLIGFCVCICEPPAAQDRQRLLLKLRGDPANGLPPLIAKFFDPVLLKHLSRGGLK